ncbi:MAG: CRISPR-associated endonuclease Cas2 [Candidatus Nezhaarchaeales archaeon]
MPYIFVAYDISDDRRRALVCEELKSLGFSMLQRSVYVARGGSSRAKDCARAVQRLVRNDVDAVLVMVVPTEVLDKAITIGVRRARIHEGNYAIL